MKGIIIIEGPDGSGKTTLAKRLAFDYNGTILHQTYRFKNKIHLYYLAIFKKALKLADKKLVILDRFHISEEIYAKVFRNGTKWPWLIKIINNIIEELKIPVILCVPLNLSQGLKWFNKAKKERIEQYNNINNVIKEYLLYAKKNINKSNIIIYNKEDIENYKKVIKKIKEV